MADKKKAYVNLKVVSYIRKAKGLNLTNRAIILNLRKAGWDKDVILSAFNFLSAKKVRVPLVKNLSGKSYKKHLILSKIKYAFIFVCIFVVTLTILSYGFITKNWHIGNYTFITRVSNKFFKDIAEHPFQFTVNYHDPLSVSVNQGNAELLLNSPGAELKFTALNKPEGNISGQLTLKTVNNKNSEFKATGEYVAHSTNLFLRFWPDSNVKIPSAFEKLFGSWLQTNFSLFSVPQNALAKKVEFIGLENINSAHLLHYKLTIDTEYFSTLLQNLSKKHTVIKDVSLVSTLDSYSKNFAPSQIDLWVNPLSQATEKLTFSANAPSLSAITEQAIGTNDSARRSNINSARILAEIIEIQNKLEEFKNKNNGYPPGDKGVATALKVPWPAQVQSEECSEQYRRVYYTAEGVANKKGLFPSYNITFCLSDTVGNYDAGVGIVSPAGLLTNCPGDKTCFKPQIKTNSTTPKPQNPNSAVITVTVENLEEYRGEIVKIPNNTVPLLWSTYKRP